MKVPLFLMGKISAMFLLIKVELNTVFQKYALFPHMTIYQNIAFGLKIKKMSKDVIEQKVMKMLKLIGLEGYENKNVTLFPEGSSSVLRLPELW